MFSSVLEEWPCAYEVKIFVVYFFPHKVIVHFEVGQNIRIYILTFLTY